MFWSGVLCCLFTSAAVYCAALYSHSRRTADRQTAEPILPPVLHSGEACCVDQARLAAALPISESTLLSEPPSSFARAGITEPIDVFLLARIKKKADTQANVIAQTQDPLLGRLMPKVVEDVVAPAVSKSMGPTAAGTDLGPAARPSDSLLRPVDARSGRGGIRPKVDTLEFRPTDAAQGERGRLPF
jgi:hypothetical protein